MSRKIFVLGGTGFMGQALIRELLSRHHNVQALVRPGSENKLPPQVEPFTGDPLNRSSYISYLKPHHTVVQLVGVAHPSPLKKKLFEEIDFTAGRESVLAATQVGVENFVYVSVAQPAPIMKSYIEARSKVEQLLCESKLNATVLRPWYVLGPGRWWPLIIQPLFWVFENQSATRQSALRLGFVNREQMITSMVHAIEFPSKGFRVWEVPDIRNTQKNRV